MEKKYQELFDDYEKKISSFLELAWGAKQGNTDAREKINGIISDENGERIRSSFDKNVFEQLLESISEMTEKESLKELKEKTIAQMKADFDFYPEAEKKVRTKYGDGIGGVIGRIIPSDDADNSRATEIASKYPRLADLESGEFFKDFSVKDDSDENTDEDECGEEITAGEVIGNALGAVVSAPLYAIGAGLNALSSGIDWLTDKIPVVG